MSIVLRVAALSDLSLLRSWDQEPHVQFATGAEAGEEDDWLEEQLTNPSKFVWIFVAELGGVPIGCVQVCDPVCEETHYWGNLADVLQLPRSALELGPDQTSAFRAIDIWIGPREFLGKGYGTEMMWLAHEFCFNTAHVHTIIIDPLMINTRAIKFYKTLGYTIVREFDFDEDHCLIMQLHKS